MLKFSLSQNLLNPKFEGYKYNPNFLKVTSADNEFISSEFLLKETFYDFDHLKLISFINNLYYNNFKQNDSVYYISNEGFIVSINLSLTHEGVYFTKLIKTQMNAYLSTNVTTNMTTNITANITENVSTNVSDEYSPKLEFVRENECVVMHSNCALSLYKITYEETEITKESWELVTTLNLADKIGNFYSYSAQYIKETKLYRFVTVSLANSTKLSHKNANKIRIFDVSFNVSQNESSNVQIIKEYECLNVPFLANLIGGDSSYCCFLTNRSIFYNNKNNEVNKETSYSWSQTDEMISISPYILVKNIDESSINCKFSSDTFDFALNNQEGKTLRLCVRLFKQIIPESSKWSISNDKKLEINLIKKEPDLWTQVFEDENLVNIFIESLIAYKNISNLDAFTTDNPNEQGKELNSMTSNYDCMDDRDFLTDSDGLLDFYLMDLSSQNVQKIATNSSQLLFSQSYPNELDFCLDSLEDGIVWNISTFKKTPILTHKTTFHALSYISATKRDTAFRFVDSTNQNYLLILDCNGHIFVYENPNLVSLKTRKPSQSSFNIHERPLGVAMIRNKAIILTRNKTFVTTVNI